MGKVNNGQAVSSCHMCDSRDLNGILDLGYHPPSDAFLKKEHLDKSEEAFPLRLVVCQKCGLLQIDYLVDPEILFQTDYPYESSTTKTGREHYYNMAKSICSKFSVADDSLTIDIGSNVGVLLEGFKKVGMQVLGVDPAEPAAKRANENGVETIIDFFDKKVAQNILDTKGPAKIITGTNVFAHIHDLDSAVEGMALLLDKDGILVIESPYALDLVENLEYDTIYHEHILYLSVQPMAKYFKKFGLELFDLEKTDIHGGSLRYFVGKEGIHKVEDVVDKYIAEENKAGLYSLNRLEKFAADVRQHKIDMITLLIDLKKQGKKIAGLSAPAKGNTLLNYCNIDKDFLDFLTEKTEAKIGLYSPGTHIPIYSDEKLLEEQPDYALILAWNFAPEIMKNLSEYKKRGGKFIIPIPNPKII